jgi:hypothetical protein
MIFGVLGEEGVKKGIRDRERSSVAMHRPGDGAAVGRFPDVLRP